MYREVEVELEVYRLGGVRDSSCFRGVERSMLSCILFL